MKGPLHVLSFNCETLFSFNEFTAVIFGRIFLGECLQSGENL